MDSNLISIWVSYTEQASELTSKRLTMSSILFTVLSVLLGISIPYLGLPGLIASIIGILLSTSWLILICSFKNLSKAKYSVIYKIEEKMTISPYKDEWEIAKKNNYFQLTTCEITISFIFILGFITLIILSAISIR